MRIWAGIAKCPGFTSERDASRDTSPMKGLADVHRPHVLKDPCFVGSATFEC
jgi:hypothetical protein